MGCADFTVYLHKMQKKYENTKHGVRQNKFNRIKTMQTRMIIY